MADKQVGGVAAEIGKRRPFDMLEEEAYVNLLRTHSRLTANFDRLFAEHGLTGPQYNVLRILRGHQRSMRVCRIAELMVTRQPDITRLIDRIEAAGWVSRRRCAEDRRVVWVELTREGAALVGKLGRPVAELHRQLLGGLSKRKLQQLSTLLQEARKAASRGGLSNDK